MAFMPSGQNFATSSKEGVNFAICNTIDTVKNPENPALQFQLGEFVMGQDESEWVYAQPAANYAVGTVGFFDTSWKFTAITTANAAAVSGQKVGVMSQVASTVASPTTTNFEGVWVQVSGGCPAIQAAASTTANAQLYTSTTAGQLTSTASGNVAINGIILTTAVGGGGAATAVGILNNPEVLLTT